MSIENLKIAGDITKKIKKEIPKIAKSGENLLSIAESIESLIDEDEAMPAFPVNISINEIAAHYTPVFNERKKIEDTDLVKIDFGVLYNDAITDTSITVNHAGNYSDMISAVNDALNKAIKAIKPGASNGDIGEVIETTIKSRGFVPISNLCGHKIEEQNLHAGVEIPNVKSQNNYSFKEGDVFAVEPFLTTKDGAGYVKEIDQVEIYSVFMPSMLRMRESRKILEFVFENYGAMPFAERWIKKQFGDSLLINASLKELMKTHCFKAYPVLVEKNNKIVAQAEHTVLVTENGAEVIT